MSDPRSCGQCRHALSFTHPGTKPERLTPDNRKLRWWEIVFGPSAPVIDMRWSIAEAVLSHWQAANNRHFYFMECRRFPETLTVSKTYFCGEYAPASVDTRPEGGDGTAPFTSGAAPKADAQNPNDSNAQSPLPAPPDNQ